MRRCIGQELLTERWNVNRIESTAEARRSRGREQFKLPTDLRDWIDAHTLLAWVQEEVGRLNWGNPELVEYLRQNPEYQPKTLLTLLALACLTQIYSSEALVKLCHSDLLFRSACGGKAPFAEELSSFRRKNRVVIERILSRVFQRAIQHRFSLAESALPAELGPDLRSLAVERLDIARHMDT
jgi:transposase